MSLTSNQEAGDSYIQPEKKTRSRILGGYGGLCSTYIAKLAGVAPVTARRFLKSTGSAKNNTCTVETIREFIFYYRAQEIAKTLRKDLNSPIVDDMLNWLPVPGRK